MTNLIITRSFSLHAIALMVAGVLALNDGIAIDKTVEAQELIGPGPVATGSDDLLGESLDEYQQTLEEHLLRKERAKAEARARFDSRSTDLIPTTPSPRRISPVDSPANSPANASGNTLDATLRALREKLGASSADEDEPIDPLDALPPPADRKSPAGENPKAADNKDTDGSVPSPSDRDVRTNPFSRPDSPPAVPRVLPKTDPPKRDRPQREIPKFQPEPRNTDHVPRSLPPTDRVVDALPLPEPPVEPKSEPDSEPSDQRNATSPSPMVSVLDAMPSPDPNDWHHLVDAEKNRWAPPVNFRPNTHFGNVTCTCCGGCVDRKGVGVYDEMGVASGVGTRERAACQCWRCPHQPPFNLYGPGGYVGPARSAPVAEYRLRSGDQIQLTFLIKTVRTAGAYRLVVGDQLLIESDADANLTRGSLERGLEIQPDGTLTLRFIGQVHAAGQTIAQLRDLLNDRYEEFYPEPSIDVTPVQTGNVARQIREAISGSEGFNPQQTTQTVTPEGTLRLPRLGAIPTQGLTLGELKREINLRYDSLGAGLEVEVVLDQQASHFVYVLGEVVQPGRFEMTAPTTVLGGLSLAGSYVPGANLRQVVIFRRGPNWELISTVLDLRGAILGKASNPPDEIWLQDGDVVIVPPMPIRVFDRFVRQVFTEGIYGIVPFSGFGVTLGNNGFRN